MKRVIITGARGQIGSGLARCLEGGDYEVSRLSLRDGAWKTDRFSGVDVLVHTAALVHQRETPENAGLYRQVNCELTRDLAAKAKAEGVGQFVFLSSGSVYGKIEGVITGSTVPQPVTEYGKSKLDAEKALISMRGEGFAIAILRPLMVYGPGCKGNYRTLEKLARILPVLPDYPNRRSLVSLETLCAQMKDLIDRRAEGIFFPQEETAVCTCELVQRIAERQGRHLRRTRLLNPAVSLLRTMTPQGKKAFGDLVYQDLRSLPLDGPGEGMNGRE